MKKCFYKTFQKCSQNEMNRLNFEMAAFCFDDDPETGINWSARTSHHFFVQLGPSWLNDCLQGVQIGVVTSWNIPFQNRPDSKVHGIDIRTWGWPQLLDPKASEMILASLLGRIRCVSWSTVLFEDVIVLKSFCKARKNFFIQHVHINLAVDIHALINEDKRRFAPAWRNSSPNHNSNRFMAPKRSSGVDQ